jgi:UDP-N-acetylmuramoyl-tripeptide--D-alanyl-D-alanine ligase
MIGVQGDARYFLEGARENGMSPSVLSFAENAEEATELLAARLCPGDLVLIKGSRGVRLDRMIDALTGRYTVRTDEVEKTRGAKLC